jgi:predicted  nucleic acid-binding Zn-ribbon protein
MPFWKKEKYSDAPTCTKCGAIYPTNARFCPQCGEEVKVPPAPTPSKPKKSEEAEEDWHKNMVRSLKKNGWSDHDIATRNDFKKEYVMSEPPIKAAPKTKPKKRKLNEAGKQQMREAMGDLGTVLTFGFAGAAWTGRKQRQRREKAQGERIESLLRDIKNKK